VTGASAAVTGVAGSLTGAAAAADPATVARILARRARELAVPLPGPDTGDTVELVVLTVGPEQYGVETGHVVEVLTLAGLARVPGLPRPWAGLVNVRGTLYPVLDLRCYLSLPEPAQRVEAAKVALVADAGLTVGLLVDDALEIRRIPVGQLGPPLVGSAGATRAQVRGVTPDLLTVLNAAGLLADPRLVVREEPT
jgi:purine-binding chemotaxis protein CheW